MVGCNSGQNSELPNVLQYNLCLPKVKGKPNASPSKAIKVNFMTKNYADSPYQLASWVA